MVERVDDDPRLELIQQSSQPGEAAGENGRGRPADCQEVARRRVFQEGCFQEECWDCTPKSRGAGAAVSPAANTGTRRLRHARQKLVLFGQQWTGGMAAG